MYQPMNAAGQIVLGLDQHDALVPGPAKVPAMPHVDVATIGASGDAGRLVPSVLLHGQPVARRGHTIDGRVLHVPMGPNLTLPLVLHGSAAELGLGARNVLVRDEPVAAGTMFVTLCADPMARPTGLVVAPTNVFVRVDLVDVLLAAASYVFDQVVDGLATWGVGRLWNARVARELRATVALSAARLEALVRAVADEAHAGSALGRLVVPLVEQAVTRVVARASAILERDAGRRAAAAVEAATERLGAHGRAVAKTAADAVADEVRSYLESGVEDAGLAAAALAG